MANETQLELEAVLGRFRVEYGRDLERDAKREAPVKSGALRNSLDVRVRRGSVEVMAAPHGAIQNARGPNKGWLDEALDKALE